MGVDFGNDLIGGFDQGNCQTYQVIEIIVHQKVFFYLL